MIRSSIIAVLVSLVVAPAAGAKYLHVRDIMPSVGRFIAADARYQQATGAQFGHCWRGGPHVVECTYTLDGVYVLEVSPDGTVTAGVGDVFGNAPAPPSHWLVVAVLRGGRLRLHAE